MVAEAAAERGRRRRSAAARCALHSCGLGSRRGAAGCVRDWNLDQLISWNWIDEMGKSQSLVSAVSRVVSRVSSKGAGLEIKPLWPCLTLRERLSLFSSVGVLRWGRVSALSEACFEKR